MKKNLTVSSWIAKTMLTRTSPPLQAEMSCTGEGKMSNSYTVYCKDGEYWAYSGSKEKAEAYDEGKATAWADETCGTGKITN